MLTKEEEEAAKKAAEEAAEEAKVKEEAEAEQIALKAKKAATKAADLAKVKAADIGKKLWAGKFKIKFTESINFTYAGLYFEKKKDAEMSVNETLFKIMLIRGVANLVP